MVNAYNGLNNAYNCLLVSQRTGAWKTPIKGVNEKLVNGKM